MNRRMESLLGQPEGAPEGGPPEEGAREDHPDGSWRADALGKSRHARLTEHLREPLDDQDPEKAERICAEVCRNLLQDFAPALMLVPGDSRRRCQALTCWLQTLFDFARQPGVEGERLAALNRLEFSLEQSLDEGPIGQPVFVTMALEEGREPWPRGALDTLLASARRRIYQPRLDSVDEVVADTARLSAAIHSAITGKEASAELIEFIGALIRLGGLMQLGQAMRRDQAGLALAELPSTRDRARPLDRDTVERALRAELGRIKPPLEDKSAVATAPPSYRRALGYLRRAGLDLATQMEELGLQAVESPPKLGAGRRLWLLIVSRFA